MKVRKDPATGELYAMWKGWKIVQPANLCVIRTNEPRILIEEGTDITVKDFNVGMGWYEVFIKGRAREGYAIWCGPKPSGRSWSGERT